MTYSKEVLGAVIRRLREERNLTQEQLGIAAGYTGGAGVSVSRIENGSVAPSPSRIKGIAEALDVSVDELIALAMGEERSSHGRPAGRSRTVKERRELLERELDDRANRVSHAEQEYELAFDRATRDFLMRLVELASRIMGAPDAPRPSAPTRDADTPEGEAAVRVDVTRLVVGRALAQAALDADVRDAVDRAAKYTSFAEVLARASMDAQEASTATLAALVTGRTVAGVARTASKAAMSKPAGAVLFAAGAAVPIYGALAVLTRAVVLRSRKQQREAAELLDGAELAFNERSRSIEDLVRLLGAATDTLNYIAIHASHALSRWGKDLGKEPRTWESLSTSERNQYLDFVEIAAAQYRIRTIDFANFLTSDDLDRATVLADKILTQTNDVVVSRV